MEKMTEEELKAKIQALGLPEDDPRIKPIVCALIGHSNIVSTFFGEVYCVRCDDKIGDSLMGMYNFKNKVIIGHNCEECRTNYEKLGWEEKFLVPDPFAKTDTEEEVDDTTDRDE